MTPSGIETATFRLVATNQLRHRLPDLNRALLQNNEINHPSVQSE
jgi:hypothetical protein